MLVLNDKFVASILLLELAASRVQLNWEELFKALRVIEPLAED
jgi:hypothetical protein